jgi:hypothetical protein
MLCRAGRGACAPAVPAVVGAEGGLHCLRREAAASGGARRGCGCGTRAHQVRGLWRQYSAF